MTIVKEVDFLNKLEQKAGGRDNSNFAYGALWWVNFNSYLPHTVLNSVHVLNHKSFGEAMKKELVKIPESWDPKTISDEPLRESLIELGLYSLKYIFSPNGGEEYEYEFDYESEKIELVCEIEKSKNAYEKYFKREISREQYEKLRGRVWNPNTGEEGIDPLDIVYAALRRNPETNHEINEKCISVTQSEINEVALSLLTKEQIKQAEELALRNKIERLKKGANAR
ncbi:hypothetical protein [Vibrio alginolyticus]|uniref:hypothetical protein n=1 Tax=Vibrio alginolyticus TaxID=663 RepID=UPI0006CA6E00|nr:hypothetical protein [Vibrio alginolyticus]KPM97496.1 hypothetical protein AOG25_13570 [Vibrio alginolyticus]